MSVVFVTLILPCIFNFIIYIGLEVFLKIVLFRNMICLWFHMHTGFSFSYGGSSLYF